MYGQYWLPYPSKALYFLLPQPPAPLGTRCCQNPRDPSSCSSSTPGPHGANPSPPGQPQEQTPVDGPHAEVGIRPQLKPRGSVAKEEDPKASRHLHQLQIKSTHQPGSLCVCGIDKGSLRAPTKENALALMAVDPGGKNSEAEDQTEPKLPPQQLQRSAQC